MQFLLSHSTGMVFQSYRGKSTSLSQASKAFRNAAPSIAFGLISNTSNFIFYALAMPLNLKSFPHIITISCRLCLLFVLPERLLSGLLPLIHSYSPQALLFQRLDFLIRSSTLLCLQSSVPTYILLTQHLPWHIHKLSLFHRSNDSAESELSPTHHLRTSRIYLPGRRLINVFKPNDMRLYINRSNVYVGEGGGKELAMGHTEFCSLFFCE